MLWRILILRGGDKRRSTPYKLWRHCADETQSNPSFGAFLIFLKFQNAELHVLVHCVVWIWVCRESFSFSIITRNLLSFFLKISLSDPKFQNVCLTSKNQNDLIESIWLSLIYFYKAGQRKLIQTSMHLMHWFMFELILRCYN